MKTTANTRPWGIGLTCYSDGMKPIHMRRLYPGFALLLGALAACGEGGEGLGGSSPTTLTVEIPAGDFLSTGRIEYTFACGEGAGAESTDPGFRLEGNLERVGVGSRPDRPTEVWRVASDLPPGDCRVQLRARDADDEVICSAMEAFTVSADTATEVYHFATCDIVDIFLPLGGLLVTIETPKPISPAGVFGIAYTVSCDARLEEDQVLGPVIINGEVTSPGEGLADFGSGPVATSIWSTAFESLPPGSCDVELRALDEAGELACASEHGVEVQGDRVDYLHVLLACTD